MENNTEIMLEVEDEVGNTDNDELSHKNDNDNINNDELSHKQDDKFEPKAFHKKVFIELDDAGECKVSDSEPIISNYKTLTVPIKTNYDNKFIPDDGRKTTRGERYSKFSDIGPVETLAKQSNEYDLVSQQDLNNTIYKINMSPDVALSSFIDKTESKGKSQDRIAFIYRIVNASLKLSYILANATVFALGGNIIGQKNGTSVDGSDQNDDNIIPIVVTTISGLLLALHSIETVFGLPNNAYASLDFAVNIRGLSRDAKALLRSETSDDIKWAGLNTLSEKYDTFNLEYYSGKHIDKSEVKTQ